MYTLILTRSERRILDWAEGSYGYGEIGRLLRVNCQRDEEDDASWDDDGAITFNIPEHVAWEMQEHCQEDDVPFPCAPDELKHKLYTLFEKVV